MVRSSVTKIIVSLTQNPEKWVETFIGYKCADISVNKNCTEIYSPVLIKLTRSERRTLKIAFDNWANQTVVRSLEKPPI
jgi:hypothetical protein